jgi:CRP-like cAMP-binding protein
MKASAAKSTKTGRAFESLVKNAVEDYTPLTLRKGKTLFSQGEDGDAIYLIHTGQVQLTVLSSRGKAAILTTLGPQALLGEECLVANSRRTSTATSLEPSTVFRIEKRFKLEALHVHPQLSEEFMKSLLARGIDLEKALCDQIFNHSERRLACALLSLSRTGRQHKAPDATLSEVTPKMLAEILGTTRSQVRRFMRKFKGLGLIDYKDGGDILVRSEALTEAVLHA